MALKNTGWLDLSTFANDSASGGSLTWDNPSNAGDSDNSYASETVAAASGSQNSGTTHYLKATGIGSPLPFGAVIRGIEARFERHKVQNPSTQITRDSSIKIVKGGAISGDEQSESAEWPTSDAYAVYGSSSDLWGLTWLEDDINSGNFGFGVSAFMQATGQPPNPGSVQALIDHMQVRVYYEETVGMFLVM